MPTTDLMLCRACGQPDRASEGYPCRDCGTFICLPCTLRGVERCRACAPEGEPEVPASPPPGPRIRGI
jgi:hypothetical protein